MATVSKKYSADCINCVLNLQKNVDITKNNYCKHTLSKPTSCAAFPSISNQNKANIVPSPWAQSSAQFESTCAHVNEPTMPYKCLQTLLDTWRGITKNMRRSGGAYMRDSCCWKWVLTFTHSVTQITHFAVCYLEKRSSNLAFFFWQAPSPWSKFSYDI